MRLNQIVSLQVLHENVLVVNYGNRAFRPTAVIIWSCIFLSSIFSTP